MESLDQMGRTAPEEEQGLPWVQDIKTKEAEEFIMEKNIEIETGENESPKGSEYKIGPSKSGREDEVGIYFFDPTSTKESE